MLAQAVFGDQVLQHVEQRVARGQGDVFGLVAPIAVDALASGGVKPPGHGDFRRHEVIRSLEGHVLPAPPLAFEHLEAHGEGGAHLDGRAADLAVALGEVGVSRGKQRSALKHRQVDRGSGGQLADIDIAAVLPGRRGAQAGGGDGFGGRDGAFGRRRQHPPAPLQQLRLALGDALEQFARGSDAHHPHERRAGNPHAGQIHRGGEAVLQPPAQQAGFGELVPQKAEIVEIDRVGDGLRRDPIHVHGQQVAGLGAFHENRPGEGMGALAVHVPQLLRRGLRGDLPVHGVDGVHHHRFARFHLHHGRNVRVPAVVALVRLFRDGFAAVHLDIHRHAVKLLFRLMNY